MMNRTRIKICGVTREQDAALAQELGADALGLNFFEGSKRYVEIDRAASIAAEVGPLTALVGVFVDPDADFIRTVLDQVPLQLLQFHGDEDEAFCASFGFPWIKAVRVQNGPQIAAAAQKFQLSRGLLLDTHISGVQGGTGLTFDWNLIPALDKPYLLAGGLNPDNVGRAVAYCRPYGVDVSSGIEGAPGVKDAAKMRAFIEAVEQSDRAARESV